MFLRKKIFSLIALIAFAFSGALLAAESGKVVIKGSTTVLPITMKAIEAYKIIKPAVSVSVEGSGSGNGIKSLLEGTCDIANSSREMKKEELEKAKSSGLKIKEIVVAYDMIVPIVHPSNKVKNLTKDQLKGIYDGSITNWKQVGGDDMNIVVVSRDSSSGTYEYWHEDVMKKTDIRKDSLMQASNGAVVNTVANNKKAIGYIGFGYLDKSIKALDVNGVKATLANGKSGKYPISRKLYMYVNENNYSAEAKGFVNYILGKDGQKLVSEAGFIPLK
ncbi:MAG: Phosphate-binding protein PstS 1 precursor [Spirochaetes bacterium ADurb.Bin218]|jgi:phosphate transport system substrate-binding protein|nr:PstS family phosphate ABC transporter substrate-binding protein [Spirochaetota bacterium]OQA99703.1 MAG: Phosphate-binding protein PstS 1 precursor [Spirochaetes bacterium ADurb.Bin218]HOK92284.1 PstS family phosphate ABC transporter substrate-binding protein [Spirochaetota bacterium]HOQ12003.1 PstS family phosphate ABC transporter substrate-binding protein [Spirochaetota bacterium]HOV08163.1 PstS family phosphate ABC transporter substrate-binding protein [Spirochaetota bacterium]